MRKPIFVLFFLYFYFGFSQKAIFSNTSLISDISIQKMDAFLNVGIKNKFNSFELGSSIGFGIEKTIFQKQFAPHFECFSFFNLLKQKSTSADNFIFGPGILISATMNRIITPFRYGDFFLCYQIQLGNKIQVFHQLGYGLMIESFNGNSGSISSSSYNYFVKLGLSYAPDR